MNKKSFLSVAIGIAAVTGIWFANSSSESIPLHAHEHSHDHDHHDHEHHDHDHEHDESMLVLSDTQIEDLKIETFKAEPGNLNISFATRGKIILHPDKLAHILPKISGVAYEAKKNIGDQVAKGELIAIIESHEIAEMKSNYLAMAEREKLAHSQLQREEILYKKGISSQEEYFKTKSNFEESKINSRLTKQKLLAFGLAPADIANLETQSEQDLRYFQIYSPIEGNILSRNLTYGEYVEETTPIYEIADLNKVWVEIGIYPKDIKKVAKGQMVEISLAGEDEKVKAEIVFLSPIIQEESITAKAIAELPNLNNRWKPGTFVKVEVATQQIPVAVMIPCTAMQCMAGENFVFIRNETGFEKRVVQKGRTDNQNIEIIAGLTPGEVYASSRTFILKAEQNKFSAEHEH